MLLLAADAVVVLHMVFVIFVVLGGLLVLRWPRLIWIHVPAAVWGAAIEIGGWICPLTPLENALRERAGVGAYQGDFISHYVIPLLYPAQLTPRLQLLLAAIVVAVNAAVYAGVAYQRRPRSG